MNSRIQIAMLRRVAEALGAELRNQMTFVGGCTTSLLVTDEFTQENIRHTDDVDLIVHVMGYADYSVLQQKLQEHGFNIDIPDDDEPICAMKLGDLRVDFMPDDELVLGFTNRWYRRAVETSVRVNLTPELMINLISPVYFVATKLEAYNGRGNDDPLESRDIEDILNLVDGRTEFISEFDVAEDDVKKYISHQLELLLGVNDFDYAIQSHANMNQAREEELYERLEKIVELGK
ncbi:hypothetical protein H4F46_17580 [Pectobacterium brasiliense]|uniref:hypothetical protein n=1 Tax=Pectobacterium brasiliense TaxID=180957 RepID=UPI0004E75ACD|nr:hypothetical protein [Pectobacterium brasiliense]KFF71182.1 hypothetical protein IW00_01080 [Pectobacterium brasiliense]MBN3116702.1 hypothetical protein [Pectobacterium brasiliense]MBN3131879.1 hypothetical protein [Pectobacterium brasiliense]